MAAAFAVGITLWMMLDVPVQTLKVAHRESPVVEVIGLKAVPNNQAKPSLPALPADWKDMAAKPSPIVSDDISKKLVQRPVPSNQVAALREWPHEVALEGTPEVTIVSEDVRSGQFIYQSPHFEFSCDAQLGPEVVRHFARVFEATHRLNCLLPLDLKPAPEPQRELFHARILSEDATYAAAGGPAGSAGFYSRSGKCLYVPASSLGVKKVGERVVLDQSIEGDGTLIHEITHQMMNHWLPKLPVWFVEGSAEYVGAADFVHGRFFMGGMQDRLKQRLRNRGARRMGDSVRFAMLNVGELLGMDGKAWAASMATAAAGENYASALLLTFYLYHMDRAGDAGGVIAFLRAVEQGMPHDQAVREFILAGRRMEDFQREMGRAFEGIGVELQFTRRGGQAFQP